MSVACRGVLAVVVAAAAAGAAESPSTLEEWLDGDRDRDTLPGRVREASGLARDGMGHLWVHDDERAVIYRLRDGSGHVEEERRLGPDRVLGDFEGLAFDGRRFHLVSSTGTLVSFEAGDSEEVVDWSARRTTAQRMCEVEGLDFDALRRSLVLACKTVRDRTLARHLVLLDVPLPGEGDSLDDPPLDVRVRLAVSPEALDASGAGERISPSGVVRSERGWLVVAARERRIVEIDDAGLVLDQARLPARHVQAEGIALEGADVLTLVDEAAGGTARVTRYRRPTSTP